MAAEVYHISRTEVQGNRFQTKETELQRGGNAHAQNGDTAPLRIKHKAALKKHLNDNETRQMKNALRYQPREHATTLSLPADLINAT